MCNWGIFCFIFMDLNLNTHMLLVAPLSATPPPQLSWKRSDKLVDNEKHVVHIITPPPPDSGPPGKETCTQKLVVGFGGAEEPQHLEMVFCDIHS